jgi:transposase-like protein
MMERFASSLIEFQRRFSSEEACASDLFAARWPAGFVCPGCRGARAWALKTKVDTFECASCGRQTSVTAGTVLHASKLPLTVWFLAAFLMATHSNGISALQLQAQLGLGSYRTAWMLAAKLRRAMLAPGRHPLAGLVEVDESSLPLRSKDDPPAGGQGRSHDGKMLIAGAIEVNDGKPGRLRLAALDDYTAASLHAFIKQAIAPGSTARTDGLSSYAGLAEVGHDPHVVGAMAAHIILPWIHTAFSNLKTWGKGVYHGLRRPHLQSYLDEFVFRFNRRRSRHAAFKTILGIATAIKPAPYKMLITPDVCA